MFEILFLGNSYTFVNELDVVAAEVFSAGGVADVDTTRLAEAGYTWSMHLDETGTTGTPWEDALVDPGNAWEWVILQEQSQIPGFPHANAEWRESAEAGAALDDLAEALGSETVLLLTWGRRLGDVDNPDLYPDFPTMQGELTGGYLAYQEAFSTEARPVWIAPAGLAFQAVYDAVAAEGLTPEDDGTLFSNLYQQDGSHPSVAGTWLTAWVVYATLTGDSPVGLPLPASLPAEDAGRLQEIAAEVVIGNAAGWAYPWSSTGTDPTDTDPTDTDVTDTDATDTDTTDPADPDPADPADTSGCGCTAAPAQVPAALLAATLLGLVGRRRRR